MTDAAPVNVLDVHTQFAWLCDRLQRLRLPLEDEKQTQAAIAERLAAYGVAFERELPVTGGIIDFFVPAIGAGLEVKIKGTAHDIRRQLTRYAEEPRIHELVLVTARRIGLPEALGRRRMPVTVVDISRGWL